MGAPEVEVVDGSLLVAHVYVEGEEVHWSSGASAEHLCQSGQSIAIHVSMHVVVVVVVRVVHDCREYQKFEVVVVVGGSPMLRRWSVLLLSTRGARRRGQIAL